MVKFHVIIKLPHESNIFCNAAGEKGYVIYICIGEMSQKNTRTYENNEVGIAVDNGRSLAFQLRGPGSNPFSIHEHLSATKSFTQVV